MKRLPLQPIIDKITREESIPNHRVAGGSRLMSYGLQQHAEASALVQTMLANEKRLS